MRWTRVEELADDAPRGDANLPLEQDENADPRLMYGQCFEVDLSMNGLAASMLVGKEVGSSQTVDQVGGQSQAPQKVDKPIVVYIKEILTSKGL